jgi:cyclopropane fatty-acyl-phospholipid synthase-like methyltransferase
MKCECESFRLPTTIYSLYCSDETTLKLLLHAAQAVSFHDYKGTPPKRVLDFGCGDCSWIIQAASEWQVSSP